MAKQKYPIGIQSFPEIIEGGYSYVDKTNLMGKLIDEGKYIFLSRPRRFGKSLLLSTLHAYFDGRRDLFKGLAIDSMDLDWTPTPVLHFDFNTGLYDRPDGLEERLNTDLSSYEKEFRLDIKDDLTAAIRFEKLIKGIHEATGRKVAILVDEYDKPLLGIEENPEQFEKNQTLLKGFFSNLKSMDKYIRFAMLTGVARFSKVSIFSDLNNLNDISMYEQYQEICGWTEEELSTNFQTGIAELSKKRRETTKETMNELRTYYDGYLFSDEGRRLYNPYSVLKALFSKTIKPYWFESATPTFLAKKIKKSGIDPVSLNWQSQSYSNLIAVGLGSDNVTALMFQTGYLTIDSYDPRRQRYTLRFPNREVEIGFAENLLPLYVPSSKKPDSPFSLQNFQDDLYDGNPEDFMKRLETLVKDLPGEDHKESTYRAITYLLCLLSGTEAQAERHSYKGRSDLEVLTPDFIYVFEFKYNKSVQEAMHQIHERDYAGRYALDHRTVYLVAANFTENKDNRQLSYEIIKAKL
ncbi:MAG: ATP-binding protein [Muribaculaceae bacterium]|nr:ATP-binding protein [Muribaculaceae bacterium]